MGGIFELVIVIFDSSHLDAPWADYVVKAKIEDTDCSLECGSMQLL
jgi:hypothetical protein